MFRFVTVTRVFLYTAAFTAVIFLSAGPAWAVIEIWVSPGAAAGGSGAQGDPYTTFHHAIDQINLISPGDQVILHVNSGLYTRSAGTGEANGPATLTRGNVVIIGQAGNRPVFDPGSAAAWTNGVQISGASDVSIQYLRFESFTNGIYFSNAGPYLNGNMLKGCQTGIYGNLSTGTYPGIIENNLYISNAINGLFIDGTGGNFNGKVRHNTFHQNGLAIGATNAGTHQAHVLNNIITNSTVGISWDSASTVDYNVFYNVTTIYQGTTPHGANDVVYDPMYQSTGAGDFHLQPGSPAIDYAVPDGADPVTKDYDGLSRPQGRENDVGAFEFATLSHTYIHPGGSTGADYKLWAVALAPLDTAVTAVLGPAVGPVYDTRYVRLGGWDPGTQSYDEYPSNAHVFTGDGFWALFRNPTTFSIKGTTATTVPPSQLRAPLGALPYACYHIQPGWNQMGNPFPFAVEFYDSSESYAKVSRDSGADTAPLYSMSNTITRQKLYGWYLGAYFEAHRLEAGEGAWLNSSVEGFLCFAPIPAPAADAPTRIELSPDEDLPPYPPGYLDGVSSGGNKAGGGGGGCFTGISVD